MPLKEIPLVEEQITAVQKLIDTLIEFFVNYSFQVVGAIIVLVLALSYIEIYPVWAARLLDVDTILDGDAKQDEPG